MRYREVLDEVQPKVTLAVAIAGVLASAYGQYQSAAASKKAKRNAMNANQLASGGGGGSAAPQPTAYKFGGQSDSASGGGARLGDLLGSSQGGIKPMADQSQQGFGLGIKKLGEDAPQGSQSFGADVTHENDVMPVSKIDESQPAQAASSAPPDTGSAVSGYGQLALQLYDLYNKSRQGPAPGQQPQMGPMNLQPTANRFR